MFDDLKPSNQSGLGSAPTPPQAGDGAMADMFADTDPVADKLSAIQSGRMRPVSNTKSVPAPSASVSPPLSAVASLPSKVAGPEIKTDMMFSDDRSGRSRKLIFIVIGVFLAISLALGIYLFMTNRSAPDNSNNIINSNTNSQPPDNSNTVDNEAVNEPVEPPLDPDLADDDRDGLTNGEEKKIGTNPLLADTDNDRLFDQDEAEVYQTNPLINDTDNDDLADYDEVITWFTDPAVVDTDGDSYSDGTEVASGYNPLGPGTIDQWSPPSPEDLFKR